VSYSTGSATQVITVLAASTSSTAATLQAWDKSTAGWVRHGSPVTAHLGSAGLTSHPSEEVSATPIGSFGLSRAFGALANPGTGLPYHQTTAADWWISQEGPLYNTLQTCSSSCAFTQGDPNEHLAAIRPQYNYAVVMDVNTSPVVADGGSAFFLHVTDGTPTAGCVAIPQANLTAIMQWLTPGASPRILIGLG
jgi:L,D-peptidoglycan transpeptidase YkuD (ErfK/YbiS/YcfS/YnhG family)